MLYVYRSLSVWDNQPQTPQVGWVGLQDGGGPYGRGEQNRPPLHQAQQGGKLMETCFFGVAAFERP